MFSLRSTLHFRNFRIRSSLNSKRTFFNLTTTTMVNNFDYIPQISSNLLPYLMAIILSSTLSDDNCDGYQHSIHKPPLEVYKSSGAGFGVRASRDIQRGELLLSETPILVWENGTPSVQMKKLTDELSPEARKKLFSLSSRNDQLAIEAEEKDPVDESANIRSANGFEVQLPSIDVPFMSKDVKIPSSASFLFYNISRINHSCLPSCGHGMDFPRLRMEIFAMKDIKKGEEITIEYLPNLIGMTSNERISKIKDTFGFDCQCCLCTSPLEERAKSDDRRRFITDSVRDLHKGSLNRKEMVNVMESIRSVLKEEQYNVLPEFEFDNISKAYSVFIQMKSMQENSNNVNE